MTAIAWLLTTSPILAQQASQGTPVVGSQRPGAGFGPTPPGVTPPAVSQSPPAMEHRQPLYAPATGSPSYPGVPLGPGDALRIIVDRQPEASGEYAVNELGSLDLPLLGEVNVLGKSIGQLKAELVERYAAYFRHPQVIVTPLYRINVLGEVRQPGLYAVDLTMSLTDVLALAGGVNPTGSLHKIDLLRSGRRLRWDLSDPAVRAGEVGRFGLRSGDEIVVGEKSKGFLERASLVVGVLAAGAAIYAVAAN
jgi:polysaccharide export outer membrane protein